MLPATLLRRVSDLETKVRSTEARNVEIAADGENNLRDFKNAIAQKLEGLHEI
jgi:hypothetical protein